MSNREGNAFSWEFLSICPRAGDYMQSMFRPLRLRVVQDSGVDFVPDVDIVVNDMASGVKHFQNNTGKGDKFTVECVFMEDRNITLRVENGETIGPGWDMVDYTLKEVMDYWIRNMTPLNVVTHAVDVENGLYIITKNSSRKQTHKGVSVWSLEFTKYVTSNLTQFKTSSAGVTAALKNYEKAKQKTKKKNKAKYQTTSKYKLGHKCDYKKLVYSKKKKVVTCVKYLQLVLYNNKCYPKSKVNQIDGWYGKVTYNAVKTFQKKYHSKYNLKVTGKVDYLTYRVLCGFSVKTTSNKKK